MKTQISSKERSDTSLLLRCAVEVAVMGRYILGPGWVTAPRVGLGKRECALASRAMRRVAKDLGRRIDGAGDLDEYIATALEAARRIEERSWP